MTELRLGSVPVASAEVAIRRPPADVFEVFVDPALTTKIWFTDSTGPLALDADVRWTWAMHDASADVRVREFCRGERIEFDWDGGQGATTVEWAFTPIAIGTHVAVTETGFTGDGDAVVAHALGSTAGFTKVLVAAKALLEYDLVLDIVSGT